MSSLFTLSLVIFKLLVKLIKIHLKTSLLCIRNALWLNTDCKQCNGCGKVPCAKDVRRACPKMWQNLKVLVATATVASATTKVKHCFSPTLGASSLLQAFGGTPVGNTSRDPQIAGLFGFFLCDSHVFLYLVTSQLSFNSRHKLLSTSSWHERP